MKSVLKAIFGIYEQPEHIVSDVLDKLSQAKTANENAARTAAEAVDRLIKAYDRPRGNEASQQDRKAEGN